MRSAGAWLLPVCLMGLSPAASFAAQAGEAPPASAPVPALTAEAQDADPTSMLALYRRAPRPLVAVQVLSAAALAAGAWALGVQATWSAWVFAMAPIFLLAALPVSVGGWGTREAAAVLALAPFGVDAAGAVGAALVYGLYGLVQGGAGALAFGLGATRDNHP